MDLICNFILCYVLSYLSEPNHISRLNQISHRFHQLMQDDRLWKRFYENKYHNTELMDMSYRNRYIKCTLINRLIKKLNLCTSLIETINLKYLWLNYKHITARI